MQNLQMELEGGGCLELAFAAVKPGFEDQLFQDYFPKVGPIILEYGARPLGSFKILAPPRSHPKATFGALFFWPSTDAYDALHDDTRFKALKTTRDEALSLLSNGHFFDIPEDLSITIKPASEYRLAIGSITQADTQLLSLTCAENSPDRTYAGMTLSLSAHLTPAQSASTAAAETAAVSFNPPAA